MENPSYIRRVVCSTLVVGLAVVVTLTGCTRTSASVKSLVHYATSDEGWGDFKKGAQEFKRDNSLPKIVEGFDNYGAGVADFLRGKYEPFETSDVAAEPAGKASVSKPEVSNRQGIYSP